MKMRSELGNECQGRCAEGPPRQAAGEGAGLGGQRGCPGVGAGRRTAERPGCAPPGAAPRWLEGRSLRPRYSGGKSEVTAQRENQRSDSETACSSPQGPSSRPSSESSPGEAGLGSSAKGHPMGSSRSPCGPVGAQVPGAGRVGENRALRMSQEPEPGPSGGPPRQPPHPRSGGGLCTRASPDVHDESWVLRVNSDNS